MIHSFPENFIFEEPSFFTDPFRYVPHPAVREAARLVVKQIDSDAGLKASFSEGKMLGVLVCKTAKGAEQPCFIAAFSGNAGGKSTIEGFVPPIYDLTNPDGEFKRREAEISDLNHKIERLLDSDRLLCLEREVDDAKRGCKKELEAMKEVMAASKTRRDKIRSECSDPTILQSLIKESQHEKAEFKRLKTVLEEVVDNVQKRLEEFHREIADLKKQRGLMSENLQEWIFRQYVVNNASGESSSILDIFASKGMVPPGGTGECAAPKLLQYAFRNGLKPLAMGEFWYGRSPQTAVRTHGHFYPSCTSKCGPLLGYMLTGLSYPSSTGEVEQYTPTYHVIHEDEDIIAVEKASGVPSVPGLDGRVSMLELLEKHYGHSIHAVHRLDMDTSGVMIFAKTHEAAVHLRKQFEDHSIQKTYVARLTPDSGSGLSETVLPHWPQGEGPSDSREGLFHPAHYWNPAKTGNIKLPLAADYDERPRQKADFKQGKPAITEYEIVAENPDGSTDIIFHPITGRTHQLRVHSAHSLGLRRPIIGDLLYGGWSINFPSEIEWSEKKEAQTIRLHLHALSITFRHPRTEKSTSFTSKSFCYDLEEVNSSFA